MRRQRPARRHVPGAGARGEVAPGRDLDALALAVPAMLVYRMVFLNEPVTRDHVAAIVDGVVLPAAGVGPAGGGDSGRA
ncbi:hypothetical protein GXB85_16690 [Cellulomonas sp. APG4]|nr:hypothetical protein [Cellulomonas sp. APG4]